MVQHDGPTRTCVGCRKRAPQREMLRFARSADGVLILQLFERRARGAYLCPRLPCVTRALKRQAFGRALRARSLEITADPRELLSQVLSTLAEGSPRPRWRAVCGSLRARIEQELGPREGGT